MALTNAQTAGILRLHVRAQVPPKDGCSLTAGQRTAVIANSASLAQLGQHLDKLGAAADDDQAQMALLRGCRLWAEQQGPGGAASPDAAAEGRAVLERAAALCGERMHLWDGKQLGMAFKAMAKTSFKSCGGLRARLQAAVLADGAAMLRADGFAAVSTVLKTVAKLHQRGEGAPVSVTEDAEVLGEASLDLQSRPAAGDGRGGGSRQVRRLSATQALAAPLAAPALWQLLAPHTTLTPPPPCPSPHDWKPVFACRRGPMPPVPPGSPPH
jgi:hypothetical protein